MAEEILWTALTDTKFQCNGRVDRLSSKSSIVILLISFFLVTSKQYFSQPIDCYCPSHFTESQIRFSNSYCWVSTTYYLPSNDPIVPTSLDHIPQISYYQWVPLLFLIQALFCQLPSMLWNGLLSRSGLNVSLVFELSSSIIKSSLNEKRSLQKLVELFDRHRINSRCSSFCSSRKGFSKKCFLLGSKSFENYICNCYFIYKFFCFAMCILQVILTDRFLEGRQYIWHGLNVLYGIMQKVPWLDAHHFPSVTLCELDIRQQSRVHKYVLQCVLTINIFYEKIFALLWFWWCIVALLTIIDLITCLWQVILWRSCIRFVKKRMTIDRSMIQGTVRYFVKNYLGRDGVLILRILSRKHGDLLVQSLLEKLWWCYVPENKRTKRIGVKIDSVSASNSSTQLI